MGIELVLLLVDKTALEHLLQKTWNQLYQGMDRGDFRDARPAHDKRLKRSCDIDCEAEILDWMDSMDTQSESTVLNVLKGLDEGSQGLLHLMNWSSPGAWEVWEGRAFLYLDVALNRVIESSDDLYSESTWDDVRTRLNGIPEDEFAESVCMDWMERRKQLGETLDEKEDPKIVPTYEAHDRATRLLIHALSVLSTTPDLVGILGREHLKADLWGHGRWNLRHFLTDESWGSKTTSQTRS